MIYYNTENKNRHKRYTTCDDLVEEEKPNPIKTLFRIIYSL